MKKTVSIILIITSLLLYVFHASANNIMSYFKTVHIIESEKTVTPKEMFKLVKESAKKQLENEKQFKGPVVNTQYTKITSAGLFDYLRFH